MISTLLVSNSSLIKKIFLLAGYGYRNKKSGVLGISGVSSDFRDVTKA